MKLRPATRVVCRAARPVERREELFWRGVAVPSPLPRHIAIITDGNRRWAKSEGVSLDSAYRRGGENVDSVLTSCRILNIAALTTFMFSADNWRRDPTYVRLFLRVLEEKLREYWPQWKEDNVKIRFIGDFSRFDPKLRDLFGVIREETASNDGVLFTIAAGYSGRQDLLFSMQQLAQKIQDGVLRPEEITEALVESGLRSNRAFGHLGHPDLFIRSGGDQRMSNFLLWDMAYTELCFEQTLWPDFGPGELLAALTEFSRRDRRYGR